ncbi:hypothetical protein JHN55_26115 [Streptomyces sp. MBT56]|uniref:hypothetical protein n=1 Tax=unclassified Streptomyces TaxID=2593676 RepID=UPI00190C0F6F|nr:MULTISPECIES: hypothetical protein [unclassified Streptomyces]MBK3559938.1 hypothetical protein [Streptomyces sp. MBT56]MBK3605412.1 hypothetical protein [Streptomyces sp. MBT54]MBK6043783.1 hypothetical protein [Streptomyces sp. MBT55]
MQRTRITAKLLVGLAVTTVSGCVSVAPGTVSSPPPGPGATGQAQDVAPQIVQPPAREGLEVVPDPSRPPARPSSPAPPAAGSPAEARPAGPAGAALPPERADPPQRRAPDRAPRVPSVAVPAPPRVPGGGADVCALGRGYGGWPAGSPQARICSETYGR